MVFLGVIDNMTSPLARPMSTLQNLERQINRVERGTQQMLDGAAVAAGGAAVVAPLVMATNAANDLQEAINKNQVIFEEQSDTVLKWAQNSDRAFGLSKQAAIENAATLGNLFQGMKIGQKSAAAMSMDLVTLAADMASLNNTSVQQAVDAVRSAVLGESEPIAAYGVKLSEAAIQQQAFLMGLSKSPKNSALSDATKGLAIYGLILEKTNDRTRGDFQRNAMQMANMQRILAARMQNSAATIGTMLLPAALSLMRGFSALLDRMQAFANAHPHLFKGLVLVTAGIGGLLVVGGSLLVMLGALNVAWGSAVGGQALLHGWYQRNIVATYRNAIAVGAWRTSTDMATFSTMRQATGLAGLRLALTGTVINLQGAVMATWGYVVTTWKATAASRAFALSLLTNPLTLVAVAVVAVIAVLWKLGQAFPQVGQTISKTISGVLYWLGFLTGIVTGVFVNGFKAAVRAIWYTFAGLWDIVAGTVNLIVGLFTGDLDKVRAGTQRVMGGVVQVFQNTLGWLFTLPSKMRQLGRQMVGFLWQGLVWLVTLPGRLRTLGIQLMLGLGRGIKQGAINVWKSIKNVATGLLDRFKNYFGIRSPSRVFSEQGQYLMEGLAQGMERRAPRLVRFLKDILGPRLLKALKSGWDRAKAFGGRLLNGAVGLLGGNKSPAVNTVSTTAKFNPQNLAGNDTGARIARAAVQGLTAGWAESMPGFCSRFTRQVFQKALGPQTAKLFGTSAKETEKIWKAQGLTKTLAEIGGKAALKAGDVLFQGFGSGGYGHVATYLGNGKITHNSTMGKGGKMISDLSAFGSITSVGRLPAPTAPVTAPRAPTVPAPPKPKPTSAAPAKAPITVQNVHLPNVTNPDEFVVGMRRFFEAHQ